MISLVYAQDINGGIGYQNDLPWYLPNDLKFFKRVTMGHTIVMGRKTFESMNKRLLPGRKTIVITRDRNYGKEIEGLQVVDDINEIIQLGQENDLMVIGGAELFKAIFAYSEQIIRTLINEEFKSDTFMPKINENEWKLIKVEDGIIDSKNLYPHQYQWWKRIK